MIRCLLGIEFHDAKLPDAAKKRGGKAQKKKQKKTKRGITGEVLNVFEQSDAGARLEPCAPPQHRAPCLVQPPAPERTLDCRYLLCAFAAHALAMLTARASPELELHRSYACRAGAQMWTVPRG